MAAGRCCHSQRWHSLSSRETCFREVGKRDIARMLSDPVYMGSNRLAGLTLPGAFEPVVEPALFEQARRRLADDA